MSRISRGLKIVALMAGAAALLFWVTHHAEVSFADGLRYIREARQIAEGDFAGGLIGAIDHPVHPLSIATIHAVLGGDHPYDWQKSAQLASYLALVLTVVPVYLLGREIFEDETTPWLGCILLVSNPVLGYIAVNVLSESTFLLLWTWGLWASVRFLREGRFVWLPPAIAFGTLAYLTRPEGLLLHAALVATLLLLPIHRLTRIYWPRWWAAVGLLIVGPAMLVGPYVAVKGSFGTKPAVARVLGIAPGSPPAALEREVVLPANQTVFKTYRMATTQMIAAYAGVVPWPLIPLAVVGLVVSRRDAEGARLWIFFGVIAAASAVGLVRLHATGGYCTIRHALIPGVLLTLYAARGLVRLMRTVAIDGRWLGMGEGRIRPGPAVWAVGIGLIVGLPLYQSRTPYNSSFAPYRMAGLWLGSKLDSHDPVLDLTDWSLFFSGKPGEGFEDVDRAVDPSKMHWLVLSDAQLRSSNRAGEIARRLVAGKEPVARFPEGPDPRQLQVMVYDVSAPVGNIAGKPPEKTRLR